MDNDGVRIHALITETRAGAFKLLQMPESLPASVACYSTPLQSSPTTLSFMSITQWVNTNLTGGHAKNQKYWMLKLKVLESCMLKS